MKIALSYNGKYVCAENGGDDAGVVHANRTAIGPWETWTLEHHGDSIALQSINGRYLAAEDQGGGAVHANRLVAGPWEMFKLIAGPVGVEAFQTVDDQHYLHVTGELVDAKSLSPIGFMVTVLEADTPSQLRVDGLDFRNAQNEVVKIAGATVWSLFRQYLAGEDINPWLNECKALQINTLAVAGSMDGGLGHLNPFEHPDYFSKVTEFTKLIGEQGFYLLWIVFCDAQVWNPHPPDQQSFFQHFCDAVRGQSHVLVELANENFKNGVDASGFSKPDGIVSCSGSGGAGMDPPQPFWDFCDLHSERNGQWHTTTSTVKYAIEGYGTPFPGTHRATIVREPPGFAENEQPYRRTNNPRWAFAWGVGAATFGAGGCALTDNWNASQLLGPTTYACVEEFIRGITQVPL